MDRQTGDILHELYSLVAKRIQNPVEGSYTNYLLDKGEDKVLQKIGEQSLEFIIALKNGQDPEIIHEASDLLYHMTVGLVMEGVTWDQITDYLFERRRRDAEEAGEI